MCGPCSILRPTVQRPRWSPPGYWIEDAAAGPVVVGELGEWGTFHPVKAIALCIAALYARKAELSCAH